jgi:sarcosine oxidase, subunit alpha
VLRGPSAKVLRVPASTVTDASRIQALNDPVQITHDGEDVTLERGEMLAGGLVAAGRLLLARSPKLHRARGPYCLRGACDGCTARVNGVPNVMTCLVRTEAGDRVETQNVLGTREIDLYEATDFLFPQGFDHHRLLAGAGTSQLMTAFARRMSGLGTLPDQVLAAVPAERREIDVLIVGGGTAGLAAAAVLGPRALLVDDALAFGGSLATLRPARAAPLVQRAREAGAELRHATSALLLSREPEDGTGRITALLEGPERASYVRARVVLVASGTHDALPQFGNNDLPGIFSARAALQLFYSGISIGQRVALVGAGRFAHAFAEARQQHGVFRFDPTHTVRAKGQHAVSRLVYEEAGKTREIVVSAVAFDGPAAPAVELLGQLGATLGFDVKRGYLPQLSADGQAADALYAAGSCAASALTSAEDGTRVARVVLSTFGAS